jgi:plastocyanin
MSTRRWLLLALAPLAGAAIAIAVSVGASLITSAPAKTRTTAVGVGLREYRIALYRNRVRPGRVKFNMENLGEDGHDLQVRGPSGASTVRGTSAAVRPGQRDTLSVTLRRRGVYTLVCTIGDHANQGMVARLRVVKKL